MGTRIRIVAMAGASALAGCPSAELAPLQPCTVSGVAQQVTQEGIDKVDVLFVVDNSNSMEQEQNALARELPRMVEILASGHLDDDGVADFPPVKDMHLGVVSTDMGAAGNDNAIFGDPVCPSPGDDGVLQAGASCNVTGNFLTFDAATDDPAELGADFGCMTTLGVEGCFQEMQLDAMLKALSPPDSGQTFYGGSPGHGRAKAGPSGPNGEFLRDDAVLAVILVSDEDDCSLPDENADLLAFPGGPYGQVPVNQRCGLNPDLLHPTSRYVEGLRALKPQNPELVIFAAIVGIPKELEGESIEAMLADPSMQVAPGEGGNLRATCRRPDPMAPNDPDRVQEAYPPRRIVQVAEGFGANATVQSICQDDFSGALTNIIDKISDQLKGACLPRALTRSDQGRVNCDIVELIVDDAAQGEALCDPARGRAPLPSESLRDERTGQTHVVQPCQINQVAVVNETPQPDSATGQVLGWYYDDFSDAVVDTCSREYPTPQRITFTPGADPAQGVTVRFECLQPVLDIAPNDQGAEAVGLSCEAAAGVCTSRSCSEADVEASVVGCEQPYALACDPQSNTCQIACQHGADCPNGWICNVPVEGQGGLCVVPTCPAS